MSYYCHDMAGIFLNMVWINFNENSNSIYLHLLPTSFGYSHHMVGNMHPGQYQEKNLPYQAFTVTLVEAAFGSFDFGSSSFQTL